LVAVGKLIDDGLEDFVGVFEGNDVMVGTLV
jgi:hypothetical protein